MKLRNGTQTNKSLSVYFPEDVWKMILHEYLDINNYWRKCHMKHLRLFKPMQDGYVRKMFRNFVDRCSMHVKTFPTYYRLDNKWKVKKRIKLFINVYELFIINWNIIKMGIVLEEKSGRAANTSINRLIDTVERKSIHLRRQVREEREERYEEYISGKYFSYENDKLLDKLLCKINIFEEMLYR